MSYAQRSARHERPNILVIITDQQRFDTIGALGNTRISTPNLDRLVAYGVSFTNAYSTCPVCVPARYTLRSGCEPSRTGVYGNEGDASTHEQVRAGTGLFLSEVMSRRGYRTFGVGKFHTLPWDADLGYEIQLRSEELYESPRQRALDAYASFIAREHPEYDFLEGLMGERTEMYYVPQASALPAALGVEAWVADRVCELVRREDPRPFFGVSSFIGPHPPFAPPLPFNRYYDPDDMEDPVVGEIATDHMDEQIPWMNYAVYAEDISPGLARVLKARYYGEITYIDRCIGRILDAVESRGGPEETFIVFVADHGDHLGDHHAWQKESFFESACRIPMVLSAPGRLPVGASTDQLAGLADVFGVVTGLTGEVELRDGHDVVGVIEGECAGRRELLGLYGKPGSARFKLMLRSGSRKYVYMANGGFEQLFDVEADPGELRNLVSEGESCEELRMTAVGLLAERGVTAALAGEGKALRSFEAHRRPLERIRQFDASRGVYGFGA